MTTTLHTTQSGQGKPLVLLHGLGERSEFWEYQVPVFAQHYQVICVDLPGFGRSPASAQPPSITGMAQQVWQTLQQLQVTDFFLLGHSMGGAVAQQLTLAHPLSVRKLVLANTAPSFRPRTLRHRFELFYRLLVMRVMGAARLSRISALRQFPRDDQAELRRKSIARAASLHGNVYVESLRALTQWSVLDRLREFTMPVLVLAAEHDFISRADSVQFAYGLPRGRFRLFPNTHHAMAMEVPEDFNAVVLHFLESR